MNKLVSIIMPNYNGRIYIENTLDSILQQSYQNFEVIIVDDCSTDNSVQIIQNYQQKDKRIKLFQLKENSGRPAIPRNYGLQHVKGEYIAFLDSDDIWHFQKLEIQLFFLKKYNKQFISSRKIIFQDIPPTINEFKNFDDISYETISHKNLLQKNLIPNSSVLVEKTILENKQFRESMKYKAIEDYIMWLALHEDFDSIQIQEPLLYYRLVETSISKNKINMAKKVFLFLLEYNSQGNHNFYLKIKNFIFYVIKWLQKR